MLAIRLARFGSKKKPTYRLVVIEKDNPRDGRAVEIVGHYNPVAQPAEINIKRERVDYWMERGAQPSDTVKRLLKSQPVAEPAVTA